MTSRIACCRRVRPVTGSGISVTFGRPGTAARAALRGAGSVAVAGRCAGARRPRAAASAGRTPESTCCRIGVCLRLRQLGAAASSVFGRLAGRLVARPAGARRRFCQNGVCSTRHVAACSIFVARPAAATSAGSNERRAPWKFGRSPLDSRTDGDVRSEGVRSRVAAPGSSDRRRCRRAGASRGRAAVPGHAPAGPRVPVRPGRRPFRLPRVRGHPRPPLAEAAVLRPPAEAAGARRGISTRRGVAVLALVVARAASPAWRSCAGALGRRPAPQAADAGRRGRRWSPCSRGDTPVVDRLAGRAGCDPRAEVATCSGSTGCAVDLQAGSGLRRPDAGSRLRCVCSRRAERALAEQPVDRSTFHP